MKISSFFCKNFFRKSIKYLYDAIELHPEYLEWDDNYAFEVKCVRAIFHIGMEKSYSYLEELCKHPNAVIRKWHRGNLKNCNRKIQVYE